MSARDVGVIIFLIIMTLYVIFAWIITAVDKEEGKSERHKNRCNCCHKRH